MSNPFARPSEYFSSMTRHGITIWAHDILNELQRLRALDPSNKEALSNLLEVHKNLQEFYTWVSLRPKNASDQVSRPLQSVIRAEGIFAISHRLWDNLERELQPEEDNAFIEQMIQHLGWVWNIKTNLDNEIRHSQGLPLTSTMDTLAEVAKYAEYRNTDRGITIQNPTAIPLSSGGHSLRAVAPATKENPRNIGGQFSESRKEQTQTNANIILPQAPSLSISSVRNPKSDHLKSLRDSKSIQEQSQPSMRPAFFSLTQSPQISASVQHQLSVFCDETSRKLINLVDDDNNNAVENSSTFRVPVSSLVSTPQIRDNRLTNGSRGFAGGFKHPISREAGFKPTFDNGNGHISRNTSQPQHRGYDNSDGAMETIKPTDTPSNSDTKKKTIIGSSNKNAIMISDSPSPELIIMSNYNPRSEKYSETPVPPSMSSISSEDFEFSPSADISRTHSSDTDRLRQSTPSPPPPPSNSWTPINGLKNQQKAISREPSQVRGRSLTRRSLTRRSGEREDNNMEEIKTKRPTPTSGNQDNITDNPNQETKLSMNPITPFSDNVPPILTLTKQERPSIPDKATTLLPVHGSADNKPSPPKAKSAKDIYRPFSMRKGAKKNGST
ncbi:hypothetical protein SBOR_3934 [Sclerotinia borealis F-4128]|uniref:Uncharacterized protein n=1 Tax=Sclerotinia borealis (strain F-4128) TaxID=1432307 RepID=W9CI71_SCLBF|nr:hypothetical protein SBOR_3934 [Sclerotinia borealis F-4128]